MKAFLLFITIVASLDICLRAIVFKYMFHSCSALYSSAVTCKVMSHSESRGRTCENLLNLLSAETWMWSQFV